MGMVVNPYPPVYMGNPVGLFLWRGYGYKVVIPGGYLPIAISNYTFLVTVATRRAAFYCFGHLEALHHLQHSWPLPWIVHSAVSGNG
jgi:hypothetical protein